MLKLDRSMQHNPRSCQKHSVLGARMLQRLVLWHDVAPIVHAHHERYDGAGYPDGLTGEAIPLESRIIALCDAYDAMTSNSSYKTPMTPKDAVAEIRAHAGSQFDPKVAASFCALVEAGEIGPSGD